MRASKKSVAGARSRLLERDWELSTIRESLKAAARGVGAVVFVEAPAGGGKSALLRATREFARRTHGLVLAATGTELERDFVFGTALALLEPLWLAASPTEREAMIDGPARLAATVLQKNDATQRTKSRDRHYPTVHALFWLIRHITRSELCDGGSSSLVLLVDDGHWIDGPSLRFLAYLSGRLADLPIAIVIAARPGELAADRSALSALRRAAGGILLQPAPLSPEAVTDLVRASFPRAPGKFCAECARFTGGNPWLVIELLDKLREDEMVPSTPNSSTVRETMPERVQDAVSSRLAAMTKTERAVVKTASILGEQATVRQVARLAELEPEGVRMAADRLAAKCVLRPGVPISFVNPLVRSAVAASLAPLERAEAHVRAAHVLADEQAEPQEIASHLLQAPPEGDPAAIAPLRQAAEIAIESGDCARAIALLQRALVEHPSAAQKVDVLAELGSAEMSAGLRSGSERFSEARRLSRRPVRRGRLALDQAHSLYEQQRFAEAAAVLDAALTDLQRKPEALSAELTSAYVAVSSLVGPTSERVVERREQLLGSLPAAPTAMQRAAVAHIALREGVSGTASKQVRALAELAWADGAPLPAPGIYSLSWLLLCGALVFADELERMIELVDSRPARVGSEQSAAARRMIGYARAWARYEQGQIADAEADVNAALKSKRGGPDDLARISLALIVCCHAERGQPDQAESALATSEPIASCGSFGHALLLTVRAQLRLTEHRPEEALEDALLARQVLEPDFRNANPGAIPWRSTAALAHLALGEPERGRELVEAELELSRAAGNTRMVMRDLRVLGLVLGGRPGLVRLCEAVKLGDAHPVRLEYIRALIDFGAALRRANRRVDAREPLRRGLDLSHKGGATVLEARARTELTAAGARPRRPTSSGIDSLTVSQRRVAELAARRLTTRQIAETLFVSPKTVEFHLRQSYRKLNVASRQELSAVLSLESASPQPWPSPLTPRGSSRSWTTRSTDHGPSPRGRLE